MALYQLNMDSYLTQNSEIESLIDQYCRWLKENTSLKSIQDVTEITTPFLNRHNDFIQLYVRAAGKGTFVLSDLGSTIQDLEMCGCDVLKGHRFTLLNQTLNGFGVKLKGQELCIETQKENFCLAKHSLLQAVLSVDDLFYSAKPNVEAFFYEDVAAWLDSMEVRYIPRLNLTGQSQFQNYFDFAIPKSQKVGERLIKLVKNPTNDAARLALFSWADIKAQREATSKFYVIYKNSSKDSSKFRTAFNNYDAQSFSWEERNEYKQALVA